MRKLFLTLNLFFIFSVSAHAAVFTIEPQLSSVIFKVANLGGYTVGIFKDFSGTIGLSDDGTQLTSLVSEIKTDSAHTGQSHRDIEFMNEKLLDTPKFPTAKFTAQKIEPGKITGDLTIKGKTKKVTLDYTFSGIKKTKDGQDFVFLSARGAFNRKDFGMGFTPVLEKGKAIFADQVELNIELAGILP